MPPDLLTDTVILYSLMRNNFSGILMRREGLMFQFQDLIDAAYYFIRYFFFFVFLGVVGIAVLLGFSFVMTRLF